MKAVNCRRLIGVFVLSIVTSHALTQVPDMENPILMTSKAEPANVKRHLWEDFNKSFMNTRDVKWFWTGKHYVVNFFVEDQSQSAVFKQDGTLLHHLHFGSEKILPAEITKLVRMGYSEFNIQSVVVLTTGRKLASFIRLSDQQEIIEIRISDMGIDELRRYKIKKPPKRKSRETRLIADR